mmetsp:Transcript_13362/g.31808  ORF Transcript_13362/g.31808 Transcript_13362/m.31808 type:complete len:236 (-) Transcript_13362:811-1518(-)
MVACSSASRSCQARRSWSAAVVSAARSASNRSFSSLRTSASTRKRSISRSSWARRCACSSACCLSCCFSPSKSERCFAMSDWSSCKVSAFCWAAANRTRSSATSSCAALLTSSVDRISASSTLQRASRLSECCCSRSKTPSLALASMTSFRPAICCCDSSWISANCFAMFSVTCVRNSSIFLVCSCCIFSRMSEALSFVRRRWFSSSISLSSAARSSKSCSASSTACCCRRAKHA